MKKLVALIMVGVMVFGYVTPTYALTPKLSIPNIPKIPNISNSVKVEISESFWDKWFAEHPIKINFRIGG